DREARLLVDEVTATRKLNVDHFAGAFALAAIPARFALERGQWAEAAALTLRPSDLPWSKFPQRGSGAGAAGSGPHRGPARRHDRVEEPLLGPPERGAAPRSGGLDRAGREARRRGARADAGLRGGGGRDREAPGDAGADQARARAAGRDADRAGPARDRAPGGGGLAPARAEPLPGPVRGGPGRAAGRRDRQGPRLLRPARGARQGRRPVPPRARAGPALRGRPVVTAPFPGNPGDPRAVSSAGVFLVPGAECALRARQGAC